MYQHFCVYVEGVTEFSGSFRFYLEGLKRSRRNVVSKPEPMQEPAEAEQ